MQIGTSQLYDSSLKRMTDLSSKVADLSGQISTGKKLTEASQDTVAWGQLTQVKRATADESQYSDNLSAASSLLTQSDSALGGIETQLQRARELALRASTGTLSDDDRASIAAELDGIVDSMMETANTTDSRGQPLFGGADGTTPFAKDANGRVTYQGKGEPPAIPVSATSSVAATDSGARVFGAIKNKDGTSTDVFSIVQNLADALRNGSPDNDTDRQALGDKVNTALDGLSAADERITNVRASVGARASRVQLQQTQATALATTRETERSGLEDADTTASVVKLQQLSTTLQATQATFTKLSQLSLFNYLS